MISIEGFGDLGRERSPIGPSNSKEYKSNCQAGAWRSRGYAVIVGGGLSPDCLEADNRIGG